MNIRDLAPKLREKVIACKTPEELLALAREEGRALTDSELNEIAGGAETWYDIRCARCGSTDVMESTSILGNTFYICNSCGYRFE